MLKDDLQYVTKYSCDYEHSCKTSGCNEEGICRCGTLKVDIESFDTKGVTDILINGFDDFKKYVADRIVRKLLHGKIEVLKPIIHGGYYGEEFDGIRLTDTLREIISEHFEKIEKLKTNMALVQYALEFEYGYVLPEILKLKTAKVVTMEPGKISLPNMHHYTKLDPEIVAQYKNYDLPRCVVRKVGDKIKLVDGNHRYRAGADLDEIQVILLS